MKAVITKASDYGYQESLEVNTLEDLLAIMDKYKECTPSGNSYPSNIIIKKIYDNKNQRYFDDTFEVVIYDDYIE